MRTASWTMTSVMLAAWIVATPAAAAVQFDYSFERVEVDGNVHGPYDGTPDLVDEFDDDVLAPNFQRFFGTVEETNGGLRLHDPGNPIPFQLLPFDAEMSEAISSVLMLRDGAGDMRVRAYLPPRGSAARREPLRARVVVGPEASSSVSRSRTSTTPSRRSTPPRGTTATS